MLFECKFTDAQQYLLKKGDWQRVQNEANKVGKTGIMEIDIQGTRVYVVPEHVVEFFNIPK